MILICGASGLVGKEMCKLLDEKNIEYVGTYNKNKIEQPNMFQIDFSNPVQLEEFLSYHKITFCVFCIVERLTDICENNWNEIKKTNIDLVHNSSYLCNKLNIKFIHLSTDYVFDGSKQPNFPESEKNPLQNYGISKLISEYRVKKNCEKYCIIRTPVLYSKLSKLHDNAVTLIGKNVMDLRNITKKEDHYSIRRPLYIRDLCHFVYDCVSKNYNSIYHFYNPFNKYTKYEICQKIGNYLELSTQHIIPNSTKSEGIAPRPYDTQLNDNQYNINNYKFTDFDETLKECFENYKHPKINIQNKNDLFICLDLDGTIIESENAHYNAYKKTFEKHDQHFVDRPTWKNMITNSNVDIYLRTIFDEDTFKIIKKEKQEFLKKETIQFTKNSELFIKFLLENNFNFCVVTNTNNETLQIFKEKLPLLDEIKQWIYREDYELPKPDGQCYESAKEKYYKNEKYIIGFEDSNVGYNSLKQVTNIIYIFDNEELFQKNDGYLINDFSNLYS